MKFNRDKLEQGLILAGRNMVSDYGRLIRGTLGSYTNHNGMIVKYYDRWYVAEAVTPKSRLTPLEEYEHSMESQGYICRIWRLNGATDEERDMAAEIFYSELLGLKYANYSIAKLGIFRLINNLPWSLRIKGVFCTELVWRAWDESIPGCLKRPDGKVKKNPTPRTMENRLTAGVLADVTDSVLV